MSFKNLDISGFLSEKKEIRLFYYELKIIILFRIKLD